MTKSLGTIAAMGLILALLFFVMAGMLSPGAFRGMRGLESAPDSHPDVRQWAWDGGDKFEIDAASKVRLTQGGTPAVIVHGDSEVLKHMAFHDGILEGNDLSDCPIMIFCGGNRRSRVDVEVRGVALNELDVNGVADVDLGHIDQDRLKLRVSGAGNIEGEGRVGSLELSISGAGNANLGGLAADHVKVSLSGAGNADIAPSQDAAVTISGVGHVGLATKPKSLTSHISGVGSVDGPGVERSRHRDRDEDDSGKQIRDRERRQEHAQPIGDRILEHVEDSLKKQGLQRRTLASL